MNIKGMILMAIINNGMIKARVKGVDQTIRWFAKEEEQCKIGAQNGVMKAAEYLTQKVKDKFGSYQSTGGTGGGPWARLKIETMIRKAKKYGFSGKPLIGYGDMKESIRPIKGGKGTISASVGSDDPKMAYHVFGAPKRNLPPRDTLLCTAVEEKDACHDIIAEEVYNSI